jgi:predicted amidophosphoribosyltransferase
MEVLPPDDPLVTFEGQGPSWSLIRALKSGKAPKLSTGLGGYMALQYLKSGLPRPDFIVPVPQAFYRSCQVGYNPSLLLAEQIGKVLEAPVVLLLKRKRQLLRQMRIELKRRHFLSKASFVWRKNTSIKGKTILLVDDVIGTGSTVRACTHRLWERSPLRVIKMVAIRESI